MVSWVSAPQCGQRTIASVTGWAMGRIYCRSSVEAWPATLSHGDSFRSVWSFTG
jgi:hypothetical protein